MTAAVLRIETPEGISFSLRLASPFARALALAVDVAAVSAGTEVLAGVLRAVAVLGQDWATAAMILAAFVFMIAYGIVWEWIWNGQTIGKRLLHIRVVDANGLRLQPTQIVIRNLLRAVDMLPVFYLVGGLAALLTSRMQRLGDFAAGTVVVRETEAQAAPIDVQTAGKYNSLLEYPHLVARLRTRVHPESGAIAVRVLENRDRYTPEARLALFGELAAHFRSLTRFPDEVTDALTDEQYVRNVVQAVTRASTAKLHS